MTNLVGDTAPNWILTVVQTTHFMLRLVLLDNHINADTLVNRVTKGHLV